MFFPRLRRHAKWVFLFLALAFGLGFVGFGVGAGGVGFGDILKGSGGGSGIPSISDAQKRVDENPKDPKAFRDLATAYQAQSKTSDAIEALESYVGLRPKDTAALRELAGPVPPAGGRRAAAVPDSEIPRVLPRHDRPGAPEHHTRRTSTGPRPDLLGRFLRHLTGHEHSPGRGSDRCVERRIDLQEDRRAVAERPERPDRARPSRAERRRHDDGDRRLQEVPRSRPAR